MLSSEKQQLVDQIVSLQNELAIPAETKFLKIVRWVLTSYLIVTALRLFPKTGSPVVDTVSEAVIGFGIAFGVGRVWPKVRRWTR